MWPQILDLDRETCLGILRRLELEAYSSVAKALRAQGELNKDRRKILSDLSNALSIPLERHKAEMRRVANDELLSTIALRTTGDHSYSGLSGSWALEGRRIIPLLRRAAPLTSFSTKAEEAKAEALRKGAALPLPEKTRSKALPGSLKRGKHPPPAPLEEITANGAPHLALPVRPNLPEDIVLLPSGMAVRFRREGKSGPFTTEIIPPPTNTPKKATAAAKKPLKRKAANPASEQAKKAKVPLVSSSSASQAGGHAYARPFGGSTTPKKQQPQAMSGGANPIANTPIKPPPKVVLVADPSKSTPPPDSSSRPTLKTPPPPKLPMSKETVAKLIQSTGASPGAARILPKPGSAPIYVLAAPPPGSSSSSVVGTPTSSSSLPHPTRILSPSNNSRPPRLVQVSSGSSLPSSASTVLGPIRTIQGRSFSTPVHALHPGALRHNSTSSLTGGNNLSIASPPVGVPVSSSGKAPSVIVVQRKNNSLSPHSAQNVGSPAPSLKTTTLTTKDLINKQAKIYQTPKGGAKPLVIVSKSQSLPPSSTSSSSSNVVASTASNQNNVIVLDLSREQLKNNSILSDLLQASGILGEDSGGGDKKDHQPSKVVVTATTSITPPTSHIQSSRNLPEIRVQNASSSSNNPERTVAVRNLDVAAPAANKGSKLDKPHAPTPPPSEPGPTTAPGELLLLDNGLQKENIIKVSKKQQQPQQQNQASHNSVNFIQQQEVTESPLITIPQMSKSVISLDKVPVEIEGVLHQPPSPVETMEDISSFIEETNPNHSHSAAVVHHPEKGTAN